MTRRAARLWFGAPAAKVEGKMFLAVFDGTLVARIGAEEVDGRVLSGLDSLRRSLVNRMPRDDFAPAPHLR